MSFTVPCRNCRSTSGKHLLKFEGRLKNKEIGVILNAAKAR